MERMRIEGIKLIGELVAVTFRNLPNADDYISRFCQILSKNQINLIFLSASNTSENAQVTFCVAIEDQVQVKALIADEQGLAPRVEFIPSAGLLSIFHHQFSLKMLGLILNIFGKIHLPLYGFASSLSTLSFITDYEQMDRAVKTIQENLDVSSDQIYLKPETRVIQSREVKE